jgi:hypothetical protein
MSQFNKYIKIAQEMINEGEKGKKVKNTPQENTPQEMLEKLKKMQTDDLEFFYDKSENYGLGLNKDGQTFSFSKDFEPSEDHADNIIKNINRIKNMPAKKFNSEDKSLSLVEFNKSIKIAGGEDVDTTDAVFLSNQLIEHLKKK